MTQALAATDAQSARANDLAPLSHGDYWECPVTGIQLPTDYNGLIDKREAILTPCENHKGNQDYVKDLCRQSILLWANLCGVTYRVREVDENGKERPPKHRNIAFLTWPIQDYVLAGLADSITFGEDVLIDKSRDMGASWLVVLAGVWLWLFHEDTHGLLTSRTEDEVDKTGNPDSLFWKADMLIQKQMPWMLPCDPKELKRGGKYRQHLQLTNPENGSTISGDAATAHIGRGGRRDWVLFDEMAAMDKASEAWQAAADTAACRIGNSTPLGPGTEFTKQYTSGLANGTPKIIGLYYYNHPEKGRGRYWYTDDTGEVTGSVGRGIWMTPWLKQQIKRRDHQDLAQNILADHVGSGESFFNLAAVSRHLRDHASEPTRCEISDNFDADGQRIVEFVEDPGGRWRVWCELEPSRNTNYVMFADPAYGTGSANAACAVMDRHTGEVVAEFVDAATPPHDLAEEMALAGKYLFGGAIGYALIGWESNGPGESMHYDFRRAGYPFLYYERQVGSRNEPKTQRYGWRSDRRKKRILCAGLNKALVRDEILVPSAQALKEAEEYQFFDDGSIGPGTMKEAGTGARDAHGDRIIAISGAVMLRQEAPKYSEPEREYEPWQYGYIVEKMKREKRAAKTVPNDPFDR